MSMRNGQSLWGGHDAEAVELAGGGGLDGDGAGDVGDVDPRAVESGGLLEDAVLAFEDVELSIVPIELDVGVLGDGAEEGEVRARESSVAAGIAEVGEREGVRLAGDEVAGEHASLMGISKEGDIVDGDARVQA